MKELTAAGIVDNGIINFTQVPRFTLDEAASGMAGDSAQSFAESVKAGTVTTPGEQVSETKQYPATVKALFDKFLDAKETTEDKKELRRRGYTVADVDEYAANMPASDELSDKKFAQYDKTLARFAGKKEVQAFEDGMSSY